jgi:hypothetical protein
LGYGMANMRLIWRDAAERSGTLRVPRADRNNCFDTGLMAALASAPPAGPLDPMSADGFRRPAGARCGLQLATASISALQIFCEDTQQSIPAIRR